ncbi:MAG: META domain-containing protein [Myxococcales bacterium]|nr:MAG: META domain-containing protein [Myxococcales bacterium]
MKGIATARVLVLGTLAAMLALGGCKKGKDTANPADERREPPPASGTMSLEGMYSYMADAGIFMDCATREQWPVAMEGDNAALERAYGKAKIAPGSPLLVTVQGRLEARPNVDTKVMETNLIVTRFVRTWPRETCGSMKEVKLEDTYWALLELNGKPITVTVNAKAPYLELNSKKASAYGFGGCNRFFGSYEATERSLKFGALGATRMACPEGMDQEQELFTALASTTRYEIHGSKLLLFADKTLVARFEARARPE